MIIALLNQKGGSGKTTLAVNIAGELALRGSRVLLVDADQQHSALDWYESRQAGPHISFVGLPVKRLDRALDSHIRNFEYIIIDGPPRFDEIVRGAIVAADVVLVPVQPSPYDVWAAGEIVRLIEQVATYRQNFKAAFVVNRRIANTAIGRDVAGALAEYSIPVLRSTIGQRVAFAESANSGSTVMEIEPNGPAASEIRALVDEVLEMP